MKKAVAAVCITVGVGATGVVGASSWIGHQVGQQLTLQTKQVSTMLPTFKVIEDKVDHGLFSSTRQLTFELGCLPGAAPALPGLAPAASPGAAPIPLRFAWRDEIKHGPLIGGHVALAEIDSRLEVPEKWQAELKKFLGEQAVLSAHSTLDFAGNLGSEVLFPGVKLADATQGSLESKPVTAKFAMAGLGEPGRETTYRFEVPSMEVDSKVENESFSFKLKGLQGSGTLKPGGDPALWLRDSTTSGSIASIEFRGATPSADGSPGKPITGLFDQVKFSAESKLENGLWSTTNDMSTRARVNDFTIDKLETKTAIRRVHAATYQTFMKRLLETSLSCNPQAQQTAAFKLMADAQAQLPELLLHDPEYALDRLAVELGGQRAELSYSVGTKGVTKNDLAGTPMLMVLAQKAVAKATAQVQVGLIERAVKAVVAALGDTTSPGAGATPQVAAQAAPAAGGTAVAAVPAGQDSEQMMTLVNGMIDQVAQLGYVIREGDLIKSSASVVNGELSVNGKVMALPSLGGMPDL